MSIKIMSWVLDNSPYTGKARLIHVVLADHANDQGICWPTQQTIAARAGCTVEHVRTTVHQMVTDGYLEILENSRGRGSSHLYQLKYPKTVGVIGDGIPQVQPVNPQIQRPNTPNPSPNNRQEPSITNRCPYCSRVVKDQRKGHMCSAMNQLIRSK